MRWGHMHRRAPPSRDREADFSPSAKAGGRLAEAGGRQKRAAPLAEVRRKAAEVKGYLQLRSRPAYPGFVESAMSGHSPRFMLMFLLLLLCCSHRQGVQCLADAFVLSMS